MDDVQGLPDVVREVLGRIVSLQEEEMPITVCQTGVAPLLGPLLAVFQPEWVT